MSGVNVLNIEVSGEPARFTDPLAFRVMFECENGLPADLEWKVIYVGSAADTSLDQDLETVLVGPVAAGTSSFELTAPAPDPSKIPTEDLLGVTVLLITCAYKDQEFIRVGYYVNNEYDDGEPMEGQDLDINRITRHILADKPRVTRFPIEWE